MNTLTNDSSVHKSEMGKAIIILLNYRLRFRCWMLAEFEWILICELDIVCSFFV